jgi:hypothetical protein
MAISDDGREHLVARGLARARLVDSLTFFRTKTHAW